MVQTKQDKDGQRRDILRALTAAALFVAVLMFIPPPKYGAAQQESGISETAGHDSVAHNFRKIDSNAHQIDLNEVLIKRKGLLPDDSTNTEPTKANP